MTKFPPEEILEMDEDGSVREVEPKPMTLDVFNVLKHIASNEKIRLTLYERKQLIDEIERCWKIIKEPAFPINRALAERVRRFREENARLKAESQMSKDALDGWKRGAKKNLEKK